MILSPYWMWLTSSSIICYCLSSFPAAKRAIDLYLVDFSAILFKKSSVSWPRLTPEVYYSKRKLGYCVVGFLFQCLGGVAGGEGEATRSPLSIKSPLNHDCLSSATNHCSHLPPRLCLSSVRVNFEKRLDMSHPCWHVSRGSPIKSNFLITVTKSLYILACHISWFPGLCESETLVVPWTGHILSFCFWLCHTACVGSLFPDQGSNPCPLHRKQGVLTNGQIGKSPIVFLVAMPFHAFPSGWSLLCS